MERETNCRTVNAEEANIAVSVSPTRHTTKSNAGKTN